MRGSMAATKLWPRWTAPDHARERMGPRRDRTPPILTLSRQMSLHGRRVHEIL